MKGVCPPKPNATLDEAPEERDSIATNELGLLSMQVLFRMYA